MDGAEANRKVHFLDLRPAFGPVDPSPRHRQVGSLAGVAHLSNDNAGVLGELNDESSYFIPRYRQFRIAKLNLCTARAKRVYKYTSCIRDHSVLDHIRNLQKYHPLLCNVEAEISICKAT